MVKRWYFHPLPVLKGATDLLMPHPRSGTVALAPLKIVNRSKMPTFLNYAPSQYIAHKTYANPVSISQGTLSKYPLDARVIKRHKRQPSQKNDQILRAVTPKEPHV